MNIRKTTGRELMDNITDAAQVLADAYGIDLTDIEGTGVEGKILKSDVEARIPEEPNADYTQRGEWYDCALCNWNTPHEQQMKQHLRARHRS